MLEAHGTHLSNHGTIRQSKELHILQQEGGINAAGFLRQAALCVEFGGEPTTGGSSAAAEEEEAMLSVHGVAAVWDASQVIPR